MKTQHWHKVIALRREPARPETERERERAMPSADLSEMHLDI